MENFRSKFPDLFATFYHKLSSMVQEQIPQTSSSIHQQREHLFSDVWACWLLDNSRNALQPCLEVTQRWSSIFWLKTEALYSTYVYSLEHKTDEKTTKKVPVEVWCSEQRSSPPTESCDLVLFDALDSAWPLDSPAFSLLHCTPLIISLGNWLPAASQCYSRHRRRNQWINTRQKYRTAEHSFTKPSDQVVELPLSATQSLEVTYCYLLAVQEAPGFCHGGSS